MATLALPEETYLLWLKMRGECEEDATLRVAVTAAALQDLLLSGV